MLKRNTTTYKVMMLVNFILLVGSIVLSVKNLGNNLPSTRLTISYIVCILACLSGLLYLFEDYKKEFSKQYKTFFILYSIKEVMFIYDLFKTLDFSYSKYLATIIIEMIVCIAIFVLAFAKDLGRKNSLIIAIILLSLTIMNFIVYLNNKSLLSASLINVALVGTATIFVLGKYLDKKNRHTK